MPWNEGLTPPHLNVAAYPGSPLRVLAGPGTGKTFAIMRRVSRLLEEGENPKDILLVTFTRMAAKELVRKVSELDIDGGEDIKATTLHSLSFSMLQREQVIEATDRTPRPLLKFEVYPLLHDLKNQGIGGGILDLRKNIRAYESAWAKLQRDEPGWAQTTQEKEFEKKLVSWLKFHESMLIGELIPISLQYLRDNPASQYRMKFKHVIVDEYQDLNKAEQVLIDLLAEGAKLSIVGDDDQSIYSFKYAHPEGIITFDSFHLGTHDEVLIDCRRCPKLIIQTAKELISRNKRYPKELHEMPDNIEGEIRILQWNGQRKEAEGIAKIVKHYLEYEGISPGEVLILAQRQNIADMISQELKKLSLETNNHYNDDILEGNEIAQEQFVILILIANLNDRVALRWWLGHGSANWRAPSYSLLRDYCEQNGGSLNEVLEKMKSGLLHLNRCNPLVERYSELIDIKTRIEGKVGRELVEACFPEEIAECFQLRKISLGIVKKDTTADELLERLREELAQPEIQHERSKISIMSLHKAKGLEADLVIVPSCIDGLVPRIDKEKTPHEQQQELEENRRLFYVGITRTKKVLILSSILYMNAGMAKQMNITHRMLKEGLAKVQSSRFLGELGSFCPKPIKGEEFVETLGIGDV